MKSEGDKVKSGDIIAEIETDKATMEVEATDEGTLGRILVPEGTADVAVNTPIAVILSEGEKQRITIARALLRDAPVLILDEPTSALDVETEALVMEAIERLMEGRTTFIIAHRLSTVRRCDLILVLRDGVIAEQGTLPELLRRGGIFADYYQTQFAPQERVPAEVPIPA